MKMVIESNGAGAYSRSKPALDMKAPSATKTKGGKGAIKLKPVPQEIVDIQDDLQQSGPLKGHENENVDVPSGKVIFFYTLQFVNVDIRRSS